MSSRSKSHLCSAQNKYSRSKSPHQNSKKQLNILNNKNVHSRSKENISPNNAVINRNHSLSKKHLNISKGHLENAKLKDDSIHKKRGQCKSQNHFHSLSHLLHNKSLDQSNDSKYRSQYSSLKKSRDDSLTKNKNIKKKKI